MSGIKCTLPKCIYIYIRYKTEEERPSHPNLGKSDSVSSISSQSTVAAEQLSPNAFAYHNFKHNFFTSAQLADNMESLFSSVDQLHSSGKLTLSFEYISEIKSTPGTSFCFR